MKTIPRKTVTAAVRASNLLRATVLDEFPGHGIAGLGFGLEMTFGADGFRVMVELAYELKEYFGEVGEQAARDLASDAILSAFPDQMETVLHFPGWTLRG